jgi:hypothetical protein
MLDTALQSIPFAGLEKIPVRDVPVDFKVGKVYREYFSIRKENMPLWTSRVPQPLQNRFISDISENYVESNRISVFVGTERKNNERFFLSVFDNLEWTPVDWAVREGDSVSFRYVESNIMYIVLTYTDAGLTTVCPPFTVHDNSVEYVIPDHSHLINLSLERRYPMKDVAYTRMNGMIGGLFQAAGRANFSDAVPIHKIKDYPRFCFQYVDVSLPSTYRYFRYVATPESRANVAEIEVFDTAGNRIEGTVSGTKGNNWSLPEYVYDRDPLSYYESVAEVTPVQVTIDFGKPQKIGSFRYICRNDDNSIRDGDQYELFYCDASGWRSLGVQQGDRRHVLEYTDVPSRALYWLLDRTRGKEHRIFTCDENGKQIWW